MELPKPGEPHRKLKKFAGKWIGEETLRPAGPWKPPGERAEATFDFREGIDGFFLLADYDERIEGKPGIRGHGILGWDPKEKSYTLHWFDNFGNPPAKPGRGQWKGDTLAFEHDLGGQHRGRTIFELDGRDALNFRVEMSDDGKKWDRAVDGKYRRR